MRKDDTTEEKPLLILRPHMFNAVFPMFIRNLIYSLIIVMGLSGLLYIAQAAGAVPIYVVFGSWYSYLLFFAVVIFLSAAPLAWKMVILLNTQYYFYKNHIVKEFEFFIVRRQSVSYNQIVDMTIDISI